MKKRLLSLLLSLCIIATVVYIPTTSYAAYSVEGAFTYFATSSTTASIQGCSITSGAVTVPATIGGYDVVSISGSAFSDCTDITSVTLPEGLTTIGPYAFCGSSKGNENLTKLTTVHFPSTLTTINNYAFQGCSALSSVVLGDNVTVGDYAFDGCSGITQVTFPQTPTTIGKYAFQKCTGISELTITNASTSLGIGVFKGCSGLQKVTLPDGLTALGGSAFQNCTSLKEINYPSALTSGSSLFIGCTALTSITIPEGVTTIPYGAFNKASGLKVVKLPSTLTTLDDYAFQACTSLKEITLPDSVTTIDASAFQGCTSLSKINYPKSLTTTGKNIFKNTNISTLIIPEGVTKLPDYTFYNADTLEKLYLPSTLKTIGYSVFTGMTGTIYCSESAYGIMKLVEDNVSLAISDYIDSYDSFVYPDTDYYSLESSNLLLGYMPFELSYKVKESAEITNKKIIIKFPTTADFIQTSFEFNGIPVSDYTLTSKNQLTIPVTENQGTFRFYVKPNQYTNFLSYAKISYKKDNTSIEEIIGVVDASSPPISLYTDDRVGTNSIKVEGIAPPCADVGLYIDDCLISTITSKQSGKYSADVPLADPKNYKKYTVTAKTIEDSQEVSASNTVMYEEELPVLEKLVLGYQGQYVDLTKAGGLRHIIHKTGFYEFEVKLTHPEQINNVYVVSTRNNQKKYMDAVWNEASQSFIAAGDFEDTAPNYVPGKITVEYTKKPIDVPIGTAPDAEVLMEHMDPAFKKCTTTVNKNTEDEYDATISFSEELSSLLGDEIDLTVKTAIRTYDKDLSNLLETGDDIYSYFFDKDGSKYVLNLDFRDEETLNMIVHDIASNKQLTYKLRSKADKGSNKANTTSTVLYGISQVTGTLSEIYNIESDDEDLRKQIMAKGMTEEEQTAALKKVDELKKDRELFLLFTSIISVATVTTIGTAGAPAVAFGLLFGAVKETSGFFWNMRMANILGTGTGYSINWNIDPSGYVYEGIPSNRLEGVTTTAYWIAPDYIDENGVGDESKAVRWNSKEYDQENPLTTDWEGRYAWDVPEGLWQVKFEKDGYETKYSEWLPVPPPQTEVNMNMTCTAPPEVKKIDFKDNNVTVQFNRPVLTETIENIQILDRDKNSLSYQISYTGEVDENENECSTAFTFAVTGEPYYVKTSGSIKSYANIAMSEATLPVPFPAPSSTFDLDEKTVTLLSDANYENAQIVIATYAKETLLSVSSREVDIPRGTSEVVFEDFTTTNADTIKIFVWENLNTLTPLFQTLEVPIDPLRF